MTWKISRVEKSQQANDALKRRLGARVRLHGSLVPLLVLALLPACASAGGGATSDLANCTPLPLSTATASSAIPTPTAPVTLLYQADWSRGLSGWQATPGWSVVQGALQSDTGDGREVTVPYMPTVPDYQVQVSVQILTIPRTGGQFALRTAPRGCDAGFDIGVVGLRAGSYRPNGDHPIAIVFLDPPGAQDASSRNDTHDYEPGPDARSYQVTVQGAQATFLVDGHFFGSANSAYSIHLAHSPIRLTCSGVAIRVTMLRVLTA